MGHDAPQRYAAIESRCRPSPRGRRRFTGPTGTFLLPYGAAQGNRQPQSSHLARSPTAFRLPSISSRCARQLVTFAPLPTYPWRQKVCIRRDHFLCWRRTDGVEPGTSGVSEDHANTDTSWCVVCVFCGAMRRLSSSSAAARSARRERPMSGTRQDHDCGQRRQTTCGNRQRASPG